MNWRHLLYWLLYLALLLKSYLLTTLSCSAHRGVIYSLLFSLSLFHSSLLQSECSIMKPSFALFCSCTRHSQAAFCQPPFSYFLPLVFLPSLMVVFLPSPLMPHSHISYSPPGFRSNQGWDVLYLRSWILRNAMSKCHNKDRAPPGNFVPIFSGSKVDINVETLCVLMLLLFIKTW